MKESTDRVLYTVYDMRYPELRESIMHDEHFNNIARYMNLAAP